VNGVCKIDGETESGERRLLYQLHVFCCSSTRTEVKSSVLGQKRKSASVMVPSVNRRDHPNDLRQIHSCSRHDVAADRLTSERPGGVTTVSKTFTVLACHCGGY